MSRTTKAELLALAHEVNGALKMVVLLIDEQQDKELKEYVAEAIRSNDLALAGNPRQGITRSQDAVPVLRWGTRYGLLRGAWWANIAIRCVMQGGYCAFYADCLKDALTACRAYLFRLRRFSHYLAFLDEDNRKAQGMIDTVEQACAEVAAEAN
jgi:hypothetical protein